MEVRNKRLSDEEFFKERKEVLAQWPTGKDVDLDEAVAYHKSMPPSKKYVLKVADAKRRGIIYLQSRHGADTVQRHIELLQCCQNDGYTDFLSTWTDALTRNKRFKEAEEAVKEAESTGKPALNGFPFVYYGVAGVRKIVEAVELPVCVAANGPDLRLIAEIALAGGHTALHMGGAYSAFLSYTRNLPVEQVIRFYQYIRRLIGLYEQKGAPIETTSTGWGQLSVGLALKILQALLMAEQGVKNIQMLGGGSGNLVQNVASVITCRKLVGEYLDRFGYRDVSLTYRTGQVGGRQSTDDAQAFAAICTGPLNAVLTKSEVAEITTIDEALSVPRKERAAASLRCAKMMLNLLKDQKIEVDNKAVKTETEVQEQETRAILGRVLELGDGDVVIGSTRAFESGALDMEFSTNQNVLGKVMTVRDAEGATRWFDHGNLPFSREIAEYHRQKIAEREKQQGRKVDYDTIIADIYALSSGTLVGAPSQS